MLKHLIASAFFGIFLFSTVVSQRRNYSPRRYFYRHCPLDQTKRLRECKIHVNTKFDFNDFRLWTSELKAPVAVALYLTCSSKGKVFLPWPMKAKGLTILNVKGCTIEGVNSEARKTSSLKDELQELEIENCVFIININKLFEIIFEPITQEYDCGQEVVRKSVYRNISYAFPTKKQKQLSDRQEKMLLEAADELLLKAKQKLYRCEYSDLEFIDQSISRTRSKLYLRLMTAYSSYPKLRTFLIADNGFTEVPQELKDWRTSFPQLSYLDLSYNRISEFDFLGNPFQPDIIRSNPLEVNLSNNSVRVIPLDIQKYMTGKAPIIVDLTGNPLQCDCNFLRYKRYVIEVVRMYPEQKRLTLITCYSAGTEQMFSITEYENNDCLI